MTPDADTAADTAQENADFASGFSDEPTKPRERTATPDKPEQAAPTKITAEPEAAPDHVQITRKEWEEVRAAAARTASYESQLSRLHGTTGKLQARLAELQKDAPAPTRKVEIPEAAFADMAKDFPELAAQNRAALQAALSSLKLDGNDIDEGKIVKAMTSFIAKKEMEGLEETYPDWRVLVGAPKKEGDQPDLGSPYRKWLASKDPEYIAKLNETDSPAAIQRSIALFRRETRTAPKPASEKPRDVRADRIRAAMQPKGDGPTAPPGKSEEDEFAEGFRTARG